MPPFRESFLLRTTPPLFHPNFRGVPFGLGADVVATPSVDPKLIIRVINFELVQPICPRYTNVTDRRTDGETDGRTDDITIAIPR